MIFYNIRGELDFRTLRSPGKAKRKKEKKEHNSKTIEPQEGGYVKG